MTVSPVQILRAALFNLLFWLWTALLALVVIPFAPFMSPERMRRFAAFWQRGVQRLLRAVVGLGFEARGLENLPARPVIIASKHQSAWETLYFHTVRADIIIGLKGELKYLPLFGWYLAIAGNVFVDRGGAAKALRSLIERSKAAVARGWSILIFPEGTRMPPGAAPDYKPGVAALYRELGVPVVPVALNSGLDRAGGRSSSDRGASPSSSCRPSSPASTAGSSWPSSSTASSSATARLVAEAPH